ncbi:MAG: ATP cone domain-containing protein, partial [Spirochaetota bacterium]
MKVELKNGNWEVLVGDEAQDSAAGAGEIARETEPVVRRIIKRDGSVEPYRRSRIAGAIAKAVTAVKQAEDPQLVAALTDKVEEKLREFMQQRHPNSVPAIEEIQDLVETVLIESR